MTVVCRNHDGNGNVVGGDRTEGAAACGDDRRGNACDHGADDRCLKEKLLTQPAWRRWKRYY